MLRQQLEIDDKYAVVTPKSLCQICHKRLGSQPALVVPEMRLTPEMKLAPDMKLVHERCYQEQQKTTRSRGYEIPGIPASRAIFAALGV